MIFNLCLPSTLITGIYNLAQLGGFGTGIQSSMHARQALYLLNSILIPVERISSFSFLFIYYCLLFVFEKGFLYVALAVLKLYL